MKKIIIMSLALITISTSACAYDYPPLAKQNFYDAFIANLLGSLKESLFQQGFKPYSVNEYVSTLRARLDRKELENATWGCVSKYSPDEMQTNANQIVNKCFGKWSNDFFFKQNETAINILKK